MKNFIIPALLMLLSACSDNAVDTPPSKTTPPSIEWQKCFGGSSEDFTSLIKQTNDGGYIIVGGSESNDGDVSGHHGDSDYWIVKLTSGGAIDWQKCFGGSGSDWASSIQQTSDGGYIVAGGSESNDGDVTGHHGSSGTMDYWILKLNTRGSIEWQESLGGSNRDYATSIQQTSDGGYIVAGYSSSNNSDVTGNLGGSDSWIVKLTSTGSIQWQKSLGGSSDDSAESIQQTSDGDYIVAGGSESNDGDVTGHHSSSDTMDYWIVKLTSGGAINWQKSLGGSGYDLANLIQQTSEGGYIVAGQSDSKDGDVTGNHGGHDYWIVKLASTGSIEWQKCFGGSGWDQYTSIQQTSDGSYIVAGYSSSNGGDVTGNHGGYDYWVVKLKIP